MLKKGLHEAIFKHFDVSTLVETLDVKEEEEEEHLKQAVLLEAEAR